VLVTWEGRAEKKEVMVYFFGFDKLLRVCEGVTLGG